MVDLHGENSVTLKGAEQGEREKINLNWQCTRENRRKWALSKDQEQYFSRVAILLTGGLLGKV